MMNRAKAFSSILISFLVLNLMVLSGCNNQNATDNKPEVTILYPNWAEGIAFTHLAKVALEANGYHAIITPLEPGPIYATLAQGDADLFFDAWLPNTHSIYWDKYGDRLINLGESYSNGSTGLVVPTYVKEKSIEELNTSKIKFDGKIFGVSSGAGIHKNTLIAIEEYDLEFEQVTASGPAMISALQKAYNRKEPIIITGWKPHHMWDKFDLKFLEDPKKIYPRDVCAIISRKGFQDDMPNVAIFCKNFNLDEEQLYDLMNDIRETGKPLQASKAWYQKNRTLVDSWFPKQ